MLPWNLELLIILPKSLQYLKISYATIKLLDSAHTIIQYYVELSELIVVDDAGISWFLSKPYLSFTSIVWINQTKNKRKSFALPYVYLCEEYKSKLQV